MDSVTGPPERMLDDRDELTPMMAQYCDLCEAYPDSLVLFQNGDFYQSYCEVAEEVARVAEVTLTQRENSTGTYPMAGIPVDSAASYVETLLDAGYRVAVAEQVEDAEEASGLVDRAVTRVVTPGTVVDDELLDAGTANYVACVAASSGDADLDPDAPGTTLGVAAVDVSTGETLVTSAAGRARAVEELERLAPAEVVPAPELAFDADELDFDCAVNAHDADAFSLDAARERTGAYVARPESVLENDAELRAVGGVLAYAEYAQGDDGRLEYVSRVTRYDPRDSLELDATALRSLELFESRSHRSGDTLVDVLDDTACALGRRELVDRLRRPLVDRDRIEARLDAVEEFADAALVREAVRDHLTEVYDVERLIARASRGRANARDLRSLKASLDAVPAVKERLADAESDHLRSLREELDELADVRDLVGEAIRPDPPQEVTEGGVIREGFDDELDDLRATERDGREWVAELEETERERTGIDSLEVGHNQVHGYYIEVTNPNLDRVPDDYRRRQTLKNSERFYTPELKRREDEIFGAAERADSLEYDLFTEVRSAVAEESERVQSLASALAALDALSTLAAVAVRNDYVRPEFDADGGIRIEGGRHPVVERAQDEFVPNPADFTDGGVAIITGPNMSGKSTYMRQVALTVVMAQAGSFVPADAATLPVVDRVFTRVGASDDIAGGQSTFMREMAELTDILHNATADSLVLLDEVGRGTSTADGLAIARATTEFVHDEVGSTTLFATHYHDLTALADEYEGVFNLHFDARRDGEDVTFLHRVEPGPSSSSYGVEVARMAGVPDPVVERSRELIDEGSAGTPSDARGEPEVRPDADAEADADDTPAAETAGTPDGADATGAPGAADARGMDDDGATGDWEVIDPGAGDGADPAGANGNGGVNDTLDAYIAGETVGEANAASPGEAGGERRTRNGDGAGADEDSAARAVAEELRSLDLARTTPLEALNRLHELRQTLDDD